MTNTDDLAHFPPNPCVRPLVEYIKTQNPEITSDLHTQTLAETIIIALPDLFRKKPEIFSDLLSLTGHRSKPSAARIPDDYPLNTKQS